MVERCPLLTPRSFIEQVGLKKSFKLHDYGRKIRLRKVLREHFAVETHDTIVKTLVVPRIVLNHGSELDEPIYVVRGSRTSTPNGSMRKE